MNVIDHGLDREIQTALVSHVGRDETGEHQQCLCAVDRDRPKYKFQ